jgi:hypothetical protein
MFMITHETFVQSVAALAIGRLPLEQREAFAGLKLTYGYGSAGVRGVTYYDRWQCGATKGLKPFVEIAAGSQEGLAQLAGTTVHELGHVLAGHKAGHLKPWHEACDALGLRRIKAAGTNYVPAMFAPDLREAIAALAVPTDGTPVRRQGGDLAALLGFLAMMPAAGGTGRTCMTSRGSRGGTSRGPGSGSRMRLYHCGCEPPIKIRTARDELDATCNCCGSGFHRA